MKKYILFIALTALAVTTKAQFSYAPRIGGGLTRLKFEQPVAILASKVPMVGYFEIGAEARYQLSKSFSVESGLFYNYRNYKTDLSYTLLSINVYSNKTTSHLHYLNIPLEIVYRKKSGGLYAGAGINLGIGIAGKRREIKDFTILNFKTDTTRTYEFDGNASANLNHLKRLNTGISLKVGYAFKNYFVGINSVLGLSNISPDNGYSFKTSSFGIHAGMVLGCNCKKKKKK